MVTWKACVHPDLSSRCFDEPPVNIFNFGARRPDVEYGALAFRAFSKASTQLRVRADTDESLCEKIGASWGDQESFFGVGDELGDATDGRGDDGEANAHSFHERHREAFMVRGQNEDIGSGHEPQDVVTLAEKRESVS